MKFNLEKINYAVIPKSFIKDKLLSLKAKGLLAVMFTLPDEWDYSLKGLCKITNCGETQIRNTLNELKLLGYLDIEKKKNSLGQFEYTYNIYIERKKERAILKSI